MEQEKNVAQRLISFTEYGYKYKNIVRFMKEVIAYKGEEETIGGNIQIGKLDENGFDVLGYQDFDITATDPGPHYFYGSSLVPKYDNFEPLKESFLQIYTDKEQEDILNKNVEIITRENPSNLKFNK